MQRHSRKFATKTLLVAPLLALLAGCATPEQRVRTGLMNAGISRPVAECMASRMVDRLSLMQLRRLSSLSNLSDARPGETSLEQYLHHARALRDPEILGVVTSSGAICAVSTR